MPAGISILNREGKITYANPRGIQILGLTRDSITSKTYNTPSWHITDFDGNPFPEEKLPFKIVMNTGQDVLDVQHTIEWPDGRRRYLSINASPLRDDHQNLNGVVACITDMTEKVLKEKTMKDYIHLLNSIGGMARIGGWEYNPETQRISWSDQIFTLLEIEKSFPLDFHSALNFYLPESRTLIQAAMINTLKTGTPFDLELQVITPRGNHRWVHVTGEALQNNGKIIKLIGLCQDISAQKNKHAEQLRLNHILNSSINEFYVLNANTLRFEFVSQTALKNLGYSLKLMRSMTFVDITPEFSEMQFTKILHTLKKHELEILHYKTVHRRANGSEYFVETSMQLLELEGTPVYLAVSEDITKHLKTEKCLYESENQYRLLFTQLQEGFALHEIICDAKGIPCNYRFIDVNPAFEKLTSLKASELIGKTVLEVLPDTEPYWIETYGKVALTGESIHFEHYSQVIDRHYNVRAFSPAIGRFAVLFNDITDLKKRDEGGQPPRQGS